tara:strand:+ start:126 stop:638 length:513 start_codon:yes stop_codon:yes gene_type:complete
MGSELKELVRYFAPAIPKIAKTAERWVAMACGKNDVREWVNFVFARDGWLYGTDGHRIHRVRTERPEGFYEPATMLRVELETPGAVNRVGGFFHGRPDGLPSSVSAGVEHAGPCVKNSAQLKFVMSTFAFDKCLVMAAVNGDVSALLYVTEDKMRGTSEFGEFVLMGLRG